MSEQLFKEIRSIEQEAEQILSESEKQSAEILKSSSEQAVKALADKDAELKQLKENTLHAASQAALKSKEKKLEQSREELKGLQSQAAKRKEKAINLILDKLSKLIEE